MRTRREVLRDAAAAGTVVAAARVPAATARSRKRRRVAVLGGGMAGLAAAHELAERGFKVTVYERKALGGKARSIPVRGTGRGGRRALPGEHGFRFFPGFYHHVPDTMRRIPFPGNPEGVGNNLVDATNGKFLRADGRADAGPLGLAYDVEEALTPEGLGKLLRDQLSGYGIPPHELQFFINRLLVFVTSCDERRFGQWENTPWWDFVKAEGKSAEYQKIIAAGLTRSLVAAKETVASARTIGNMGEAFVFNILGAGNDGALDRVLDAPTSEAWIQPWVKHLRSLGVRFRVGTTVTALKMRRGSVVSALATDERGRPRSIEADWFVCAMPVERARRLLSRRVLAADPALEGMHDLFYDWMNGIQYFLTERVDIVHGHIAFMDSPWALTALTQAQFWAERDFPRDYGDGTVKDCLSVDISNWDEPGILYGKPAKQCNPKEVAAETWAQIKRHTTAGDKLPDGIVHSWFLDPAIRWNARRGRNRNDEPLLVNTAGSWVKRPTARTEIPNLFLCGDYVQTDIDLATMEGANESARAATAALLDAAGSAADPPTMYKLWKPPSLEPAKEADAELYRQGLPNALDVQGGTR